jgi:phosphonate transport system permease protein
MKIPSFIPLIESERSRRQWAGLAIEVLLWAYAAVVAVRIVGAALIMPMIEDLALDHEVGWASRLIESMQYDSRYLSMEWSTLLLVALAGAVVGGLIGSTGKGFGTWVSSITKLQVNNPEDSLKITRHWSYARKEGWFLGALTLVTGWVVTKIDLGVMMEVQGLQGFARLALQMSCGLPLVGVDFIGSGGSLFSLFQWLMNGVIGVTNGLISITGGTTFLETLHLQCIAPDAAYYSTALGKLAESIYLAFMATVFAVPIAFFMAFFGARNLMKHSASLRFVYLLVRTYMNITRSIEPLIWAILFSVWVGIGPFSGAIALMIHSISSLVKLYSEAIEGVDDGPLEALQAAGANRVATAWFAVVPQVVLPYMAFTIYRWDINVRMATIIGLVGGGGIGGLLIQEQGLANWTNVGTLAFLIFIVVWLMDLISARVREAIQ